jgi:hypothetical protein
LDPAIERIGLTLVQKYDYLMDACHIREPIASPTINSEPPLPIIVDILNHSQSFLAGAVPYWDRSQIPLSLSNGTPSVNGVLLEAGCVALRGYFRMLRVSACRSLVSPANREEWNDLMDELKPCSGILRFLFNGIPEAKAELARCQELTSSMMNAIDYCRSRVKDFDRLDLEIMVFCVSRVLSQDPPKFNQIHRTHCEAAPLFEPNFQTMSDIVDNYARELGMFTRIIEKLLRRFGGLLDLWPERHIDSVFENCTAHVPDWQSDPITVRARNGEIYYRGETVCFPSAEWPCDLITIYVDGVQQHCPSLMAHINERRDGWIIAQFNGSEWKCGELTAIVDGGESDCEDEEIERRITVYIDDVERTDNPISECIDGLYRIGKQWGRVMNIEGIQQALSDPELFRKEWQDSQPFLFPPRIPWEYRRQIASGKAIDGAD